MAKGYAARPIGTTVRTPDALPFLKWAGGKWAIAPQIASLLPADVQRRVYREPFLGGGAMFFFLQPKRAFLSDAVADLIEAYGVVKSDVEPLIRRLETLRKTHDSKQFYLIRERFNAERASRSKARAAALDRAAWLIYLNKTCFNGLFRTNKSGHFNVPVGQFVNPRVVDPDRIRASSAALAGASIHIQHRPFDHLREVARAGEVIYLDPPYVPLSKSSSFAAYCDGAFDLADQERLAQLFRELDARGCMLALSNSDTPTVRKLYAGFDLTPIVAPRAISSKASTRGPTQELLVRNPKRYP